MKICRVVWSQLREALLSPDRRSLWKEKHWIARNNSKALPQKTLNIIMANIEYHNKTQIFKLVTFFIYVVLYFTFVRYLGGAPWTTVLKCAPIVSLMLYVLLKGFNFTEEYIYSQRILLGLPSVHSLLYRMP